MPQLDLQQCNSANTPCLRQVQPPEEVLGAFARTMREAKTFFKKALASHHNQ